VLIRFSDGIIGGPVELKSAGTQWQIEENSTQHLQPAWIAPKEINIYHESGFGRRRDIDLYFVTVPLPATSKQIDSSDPIFPARSVLEYVPIVQAPDGLPRVSTFTIWRALHEGGLSWQNSRTWCETGVVMRQRTHGAVCVSDPDTTAKKS